MTKRKSAITEKWIDPDDAPELNEEWFANAGTFRDGKLVRRGRPKLANAKQHVSLRLDPDVIEAYRSSGPGWQARVNEALRKAAGI